ncbi:four helix bundle protein [Calothrix sp. 336/3]|uniref:four helix bundle protein n=1 Tax=Calothrix sp. 336/3 TaxID=1337936 RepID=UPI0004E3D3F7|nr:four helix bundle protein [Calothrix sp. 336/3]AKG24539.1 30S ribosomal protein S23 [Calothrix sp. 336/3]
MDKQSFKSFKSHEDLAIFQLAFDAAMKIFELSRSFPNEEKYSLTDPSGSVCANLAEAWRKRRYRAAFIAKLSDCESEAAETQVWIKFAVSCSYLDITVARDLYSNYSRILKGLVNMINHPEEWTLTQK